MSDRRTIKAIETVYKGYRFRSRLEARWAVFLDALGAVWEYEKEGYDLDGEWYLPDFWLPIAEPNHQGAGYWLEIKPLPLTDHEESLLCKLVEATGHNAWAFAGNVGDGEFSVTIWAMQDRGFVHSSVKRIELERDRYGPCVPVNLFSCIPLSVLQNREFDAGVEEAFAKARGCRFGERRSP